MNYPNFPELPKPDFVLNHISFVFDEEEHFYNEETMKNYSAQYAEKCMAMLLETLTSLSRLVEKA